MSRLHIGSAPGITVYTMTKSHIIMIRVDSDQTALIRRPY